VAQELSFPRVEEYVLIAQDTPQVTVHRRSAHWEPIVLADVNAIAEIRSLDLSLRPSVVYDGVL
jgi:hypothetical protein